MNDFFCRSCQIWKDKSKFAKRINGDGLRYRCMECEEAKDKKWCSHHEGFFPLTHFRCQLYESGNIGYGQCKEEYKKKNKERKQVTRRRSKSKDRRYNSDMTNCEQEIQRLICSEW